MTRTAIASSPAAIGATPAAARDAADARRVLDANIAVHSRLAAEYNTAEPHYLPESVARIESRLRDLASRTTARGLLDLGCGTGFILDIARRFVPTVHGVDATQAMLDRVRRDGPGALQLFCAETGAFEPSPGAYDLVTAHSFLHHLYEIAPTLRTAFAALRPGGCFYADLEPNADFWRAVGGLDPEGTHDAALAREIAQVRAKSDEIERRFGIPGELFDDAEYGKNRRGGFEPRALADALRQTGFRRIELHYHWFIGQSLMINESSLPRPQAVLRAEETADALRRMLPLSSPLFKYVGFTAYK